MRVSDFAFELPPALIASVPVEPRDAARMFVCERANDRRRHLQVRDLPEVLQPGDLLVVNDTRVLPHRLVGQRRTGGRVEAMILCRRGSACRGYLKPAAKLRLGEPLAMEQGALALTPTAALGGGQFEFTLAAGDAASLEATLERVGRAPLPPYLHRDGGEDAQIDRARYQTVFAAQPGAVAAPTAGLHFTADLLAALAARGVEIAPITLHVGEGTFAPIRVDVVEAHRMHAESFVLPAATARAIAATRHRGGRVVAVGTTAARTLETCATSGGQVEPRVGTTALFLYPGQPFRVVDALLTNFHLPCSTLLMLVCAFAGRERVLDLYREAVAAGYRFYSFGDAMLLR